MYSTSLRLDLSAIKISVIKPFLKIIENTTIAFVRETIVLKNKAASMKNLFGKIFPHDFAFSRYPREQKFLLNLVLGY